LFPGHAWLSNAVTQTCADRFDSVGRHPRTRTKIRPRSNRTAKRRQRTSYNPNTRSSNSTRATPRHPQRKNETHKLKNTKHWSQTSINKIYDTVLSGNKFLMNAPKNNDFTMYRFFYTRSIWSCFVLLRSPCLGYIWLSVMKSCLRFQISSKMVYY